MDTLTIIRELLMGLQGVVGPDGYLTQRDACYCDNTHAQNNTVCRICWARDAYEKYSFHQRKKVYIVRDDIDRHGAGCSCGDCNSQGRSYGVALYDVSDWLISPGDDIPEELLDAIHHSESFDRFYAPSEEAALHNARLDCEVPHWTVYE